MLIEDCVRAGVAEWTYPNLDKKVCERSRARDDGARRQGLRAGSRELLGCGPVRQTHRAALVS